MSTIISANRVLDLSASRVRGSRPAAASYVHPVDAQPRLLTGLSLPQHAAQPAVPAWREMTVAQDRGTRCADRAAQGGRLAVIGGSSVTANQKFETRSGPPSCSPPA
jgi:hypothetical protein